MRSKSSKTDVYGEVTSEIIRALEEGTVPWRKPWKCIDGTLNRNLVSGKPYRGINQLLLSLRPFSSPYWLTFKQCSDRGGKVRKGERSTLVVFWKMMNYEDKESGERKTIPMLKHYRVFNVEQCEGLTLPEPEPLPDFNPVEEAERIIRDMPNRPALDWKGDSAFYAPALDLVRLPIREAFESAAAYYNTAFHELTHSTGHKSRLSRFEIADAKCRFGSEDYSKEELVAEMGAAMLCTVAGIDGTIPASAAYIKSWLRVLKDDPKMVVHAAGKAQRAADFILGESHDGSDHE